MIFMACCRFTINLTTSVIGEEIFLVLNYMWVTGVLYYVLFLSQLSRSTMYFVKYSRKL